MVGRRQPAEHARAALPHRARAGSMRSAAARGGSAIAITAGPPGRRRASSSCELERRKAGIWLPGLTCCESAIHAAQLGWRVRHRRARRASSRLAEVRQVGPDVAARGRAADRVAARAGAVREDLRARPRRGARRAGCDSRASQRRNAGRRVGEDVQRPCARAAGRRTRRTGRGSARRRRRTSSIAFVWPGIVSIFRFSCGTQKLWMTSAVRTSTPHRRPHRDVDLVRGHRRRARVAHLPPPLVADHLDGAAVVAVAAGAWVVRITKMSEIDEQRREQRRSAGRSRRRRRRTSRARSPGLSPSVSPPMPRRWRRFHGEQQERDDDPEPDRRRRPSSTRTGSRCRAPGGSRGRARPAVRRSRTPASSSGEHDDGRSATRPPCTLCTTRLLLRQCRHGSAVPKLARR